MNGYGNDMDPYCAAGELAGIARVVDDFYANMDAFPEARVIRNMHPEDLTESRKKLTYFLCGVLGGPQLYIDHYGGVNLPDFHRQFPIGTSERDAWMLCMQPAIAVQPYGENKGVENLLFEVVRSKCLSGPSNFLDARVEPPSGTNRAIALHINR